MKVTVKGMSEQNFMAIKEELPNSSNRRRNKYPYLKPNYIFW